MIKDRIAPSGTTGAKGYITLGYAPCPVCTKVVGIQSTKRYRWHKSSKAQDNAKGLSRNYCIGSGEPLEIPLSELDPQLPPQRDTECKHDHLSGNTCPCCDPQLSAASIPNDMLLHYLRNPFGHNDATLRRARLQASDMLEECFNRGVFHD